VRVEFRRLVAQAGVRRRFAPHQLRHAHAVELAREGVPLNVIQRQLGHANLGTTSIYLQGIDTEEIIATVYAQRAPMMSATAGSNSEQSKPRQREHLGCSRCPLRAGGRVEDQCDRLEDPSAPSHRARASSLAKARRILGRATAFPRCSSARLWVPLSRRSR
jgi:hypothetical protein